MHWCSPATTPRRGLATTGRLIIRHSFATGEIGRTEIPSTYRHWESYFAAAKLPLARGWERQLDIAYNSIFYHSFSPSNYRHWLDENGVRFVALPDAAPR